MTLASERDKQDDGDKIEVGDLVWHKVTGEGPWVAIQPTMMRTNCRVLNGRKVDLFDEQDVLIEDMWLVETRTCRLAVPGPALKKRRRWLRGRNSKDALLAVTLSFWIGVVCQALGYLLVLASKHS